MVRVFSLLSALAVLSAQDALATTVTATTTTTTATTTTAVATSGIKLYGVNYNIRAGADWEPEETKCKSADVIAQELAKLKEVTDTIRLYSLMDCDQAVKVLPAAAAAGLKVTLGLWVGAEPATFAAEKLKLEQLLAQDGLVTAKNTPAIYVGSEAMYRGEVNVTTAIANAKEIKSLCAAKTLNVPVTIADTTEIYLKYPALIDAVDFASPNVFPFWDKITAEKGPAQLYSKLERLTKIAKGKDIVIGETGWPTDGVEPKGSKASMANAATYFQGFYKLAQQHNLKYYYFAGFDESWKLKSASANSTIEAYFGIFDKDGVIKDAYKALKPVATVVPTVAPTAAPTVKPTAKPTAVPSASSDASGAEDVDAGDDLPTKATVKPVATNAPSAAGKETAPTPAVTADGDVKTSAPISGVATPQTPAGNGSPSSPSIVVIPTKGDVYVPGAVTGAENSIEIDSKKPSAGASTPAATPATTKTAGSSGATGTASTKKPKRTDCDM